MRGTTGSISVAGMLRLLCSYGKTGAFEIDGEKVKGRIVLHGGSITGVEMIAGADKGATEKQSAVKLLTVVEEGSFYFDEKETGPCEPLGLCVEDLILESARNIYGAGGTSRLKDYLPPESEVLKIAKLPADKTIRVSFYSDEWNLLTAFGGDMNSGAIIDGMKMQREKATAVLYGLVSASFLRRSRFKIPEISRIARNSMGNIGGAIVDSAMAKLGMDRSKIGMKEFLALLNELENSFADITGRTRAKEIIEKIWAATK